MPGVAALRISEIFVSLQGEGIRTGEPSVFVRVSGCNLRCIWCDTPYASWSPEGPTMSIPEIIEEIRKLAGSSVKHVVVTGGEPMLFEATVELCTELRQLGLTITIETAGTVYRELECDLMSISPKLANSDPPEGSTGIAAQHSARRQETGELSRLAARYACQFKFVVNPEVEIEEQLAEIEKLLNRIGPNDHPILLMPEGTDRETLERRERLLIPVCMDRGWRLSARRHIEWFGNKRGT